MSTEDTTETTEAETENEPSPAQAAQDRWWNKMDPTELKIIKWGAILTAVAIVIAICLTTDKTSITVVEATNPSGPVLIFTDGQDPVVCVYENGTKDGNMRSQRDYDMSNIGATAQDRLLWYMHKAGHLNTGIHPYTNIPYTSGFPIDMAPPQNMLPQHPDAIYLHQLHQELLLKMGIESGIYGFEPGSQGRIMAAPSVGFSFIGE